jgi:hypothetical protein
MTLEMVIVLAVMAAGGVLLWPRLARARLWRATITPLASIIGSGFLVLGPILNDSFGYMAPLVMAALCAGGYAFGAAIRANIVTLEQGAPDLIRQRLEILSGWALAGAYVISVCYYLNLFGAFAVSLTPLHGEVAARVVTSAMLALILAVGWTRGFGALERMEQVSVGIKLAIIAGLIAGMVGYFIAQSRIDALVINTPVVTGWPAVTLLFGLIVTVQGFETSRYLGAEYDAATRVRSMRLAQSISIVIYMVYIGLLSYLFAEGSVALTETAIIDMTAIITPLLPALLVAAALSAQFSAAVADTSGSGGLVAEQSNGRFSARRTYVLLTLTGIALTWAANVFEIISYASRAFALYYALQAAIAARTARQQGQPAQALLYAALTLLGVLIILFGTPVE